MTVRELIKALQDLGEENLDKEVQHYDEYRYVPIEEIEEFRDHDYDTHTGEWVYKNIIGIY